MNIALARLGWLLFVVGFFPGTLLAQAKPQIEDNFYLNIDRNQIDWPSPSPCSQTYALRTTTYACKLLDLWDCPTNSRTRQSGYL
jgi:hypothetical protein